MTARRMMIAAGIVMAMVVMMLPSAYVGASGPPAYPRDTLHLKSGGVASQVSPDGLGGPFSPSSPRDGPPFQWSRNINAVPNPNEQDEPTIAVNQAAPNNIAIGNHERQGPAFPAAIGCAFVASFDGGANWTRFGLTPLQGPLFPAASGHSCSDSVLAADRVGNFYFAYLDLFRFTSPLRVDILVTKSTDGGQTYPTFVPVALGAGAGSGAEDPDKEWIEADTQPQSPFRGNIYVSYSDFSTFTIKFRKSVDGGTSFAPAPTAFGTIVSDLGGIALSAVYACGAHTCADFTIRYMQGSNISVGPKGEIFVFYGDFTEIETFDLNTGAFVNAQMTAAKIMLAKSGDAGTNWTRTVVRDMCSPAPCRAAGTDAHETKNAPVFRVGSLPFGGVSSDGKFVYAVWTEWNSVVFSFDPGTNRDFGVSDGNIIFARSTDGGATWEPAIRVNDDTTTNDQFFPAMLAQGGTIHIAWMDRRLDASGIRYDIFYATSPNNGKNFMANVRVTTASSNPLGTSFIGDYIDMDGARGPFQVHAAWTDRRAVGTPVGSAGNDVFTAERLMPPP